MKGKEALEILKSWYFSLNKEQQEAYNTIKTELSKLTKIKAIAQEANTHERTKINKIMKVLEE